MRKIWIIIGVLGIATLALGAAGLAYAQSETPPPFINPGYGSGMMGGHGGFGGMHGGWTNGDTGPFHELMLEAFADGLGLSADQIQIRLDSGETMWQIAESEGFSIEGFRETMWQARTTMMEQAVEDGILTQEQVDGMGNRWQAGGFGPGYGGCIGIGAQEGFHHGPDGRWNSP
jgi:hypothetical protein